MIFIINRLCVIILSELSVESRRSNRKNINVNNGNFLQFHITVTPGD